MFTDDDEGEVRLGLGVASSDGEENAMQFYYNW